MSTLSVSQIQNTASPTTNIVVNADGSVTLGLYRTTGVAPSPVQTGTLWYDVGGAGLVIWNGGAWVGVGGSTYTATAPIAVTGSVISLNLGLGVATNGTNLAVSIPVASTAPAAGTGATQALNGSLYWDDGVGALFIRYNNGGTPTWVQAAGSSNVITTNATYYVATTGNDTTGNGSATAPWATPHKAMEYLSAFVIKQGVTVTVSVADGTYTFTTPLNLNHPNGSQIFINGGTTSGPRPTTSLTGGNAVGNTGATEAANDALLQAYYNTVWQFNGCNGLVCDSGGNVTVNTVLIRGNATSPWAGVLAGNYDSTVSYASSGGINLGNTVAVHNFGGNNIVTNVGGSVIANNVTSTNSGNYGIYASYGGSIFAVSATASNNGSNGVSTNSGGSIRCDSVTTRYNGSSGIATISGGSIYAASATASNNGANGINTLYTGSINAAGATASNNGANGITAQYGGSIYAQGATASNNTVHGIVVSYGGSIFAQGATASNNGGYGAFANYGGSVDFGSGTANNNTVYGIAAIGGGSTVVGTNATATGNSSGSNVFAANMGNISFTGGNGAGLLSPAANTVGNGNSIINV